VTQTEYNYWHSSTCTLSEIQTDLCVCAVVCDSVGGGGKTRRSVNSGNCSGHVRACLKIGEKMVKVLLLLVGWTVLFCSKCSMNRSEVRLTDKLTDVPVWGI